MCYCYVVLHDSNANTSNTPLFGCEVEYFIILIHSPLFYTPETNMEPKDGPF